VGKGDNKHQGKNKVGGIWRLLEYARTNQRTLPRDWKKEGKRKVKTSVKGEKFLSKRKGKNQTILKPRQHKAKGV